MGTKNVFLTEFHEGILKRIKEVNPSFNLSGYIQDCLSKFGGDKMDESDILQRLGEIESMKVKLSSEEVIWKKKQEEFLIQKAIKEKEDKEKENKRLSEIDHREEMQRINDYLSGVENWDEYILGVKEGKWKGTIEYAKDKLSHKDNGRNIEP